MAVVFAESPSAAFAANSNLDQQRVQNYLNSIAQNQRAQLDGYNAAAQQARQRQQQQQQHQENALYVAKLVAGQRQQQQARVDAEKRTALELMLANREFGLREKELLRPTGAAIRAQEDAQAQAEADTLKAGASERIAQYMNEHDALKKMLANVSEDSVAKSLKAARSKQPYELLDLVPGIDEHTRKSELAVKQEIAGNVPSYLNATSLETAGGLPDFSKSARAALQTRIDQLAKFIPAKGADEFVTMGPSGRYEPLFRRNPLLTSSTGATAPAGAQPSLHSPQNASIHIAAAEAAVQQGADPAKVAARLEQLLKAGQ